MQSSFQVHHLLNGCWGSTENVYTEMFISNVSFIIYKEMDTAVSISLEYLT